MPLRWPWCLSHVDLQHPALSLVFQIDRFATWCLEWDMLIWCGMQWYMIYDIWEYLKMFDFVHAFLDSCVFCLWLLCIDWPCVLDSRCSSGGFTEQHVTSCEGAVWLSFCPILSSFWHVCQELNPKKDVKNILSHSDIVVGSGTVDGRHLDNQLRLLHIYLYIYTHACWSTTM